MRLNSLSRIATTCGSSSGRSAWTRPTWEYVRSIIGCATESKVTSASASQPIPSCSNWKGGSRRQRHHSRSVRQESWPGISTPSPTRCPILIGVSRCGKQATSTTSWVNASVKRINTEAPHHPPNRKKRRRDRHLFGVSLVTSFPDSLSVWLCRLEGTVSPTGDSAWMMAVQYDSSPPSPYYRVLYFICPSCRQRVHCCQRSNQGRHNTNKIIRQVPIDDVRI